MSAPEMARKGDFASSKAAKVLEFEASPVG
jgi:hypothetical protein